MRGSGKYMNLNKGAPVYIVIVKIQREYIYNKGGSELILNLK